MNCEVQYFLFLFCVETVMVSYKQRGGCAVGSDYSCNHKRVCTETISMSIHIAVVGSKGYFVLNLFLTGICTESIQRSSPNNKKSPKLTSLDGSTRVSGNAGGHLRKRRRGRREARCLAAASISAPHRPPRAVADHHQILSGAAAGGCCGSATLVTALALAPAGVERARD